MAEQKDTDRIAGQLLDLLKGKIPGTGFAGGTTQPDTDDNTLLDMIKDVLRRTMPPVQFPRQKPESVPAPQHGSTQAQFPATPTYTTAAAGVTDEWEVMKELHEREREDMRTRHEREREDMRHRQELEMEAVGAQRERNKEAEKGQRERDRDAAKDQREREQEAREREREREKEERGRGRGRGKGRGND